MKSKISFKSEHRQGLGSGRRIRRSGANDNFPGLEFETTSETREWRLVCLIAAIVCGLAAFIFLPLW